MKTVKQMSLSSSLDALVFSSFRNFSNAQPQASQELY
uniref:Uncharacterized protein n=1 Tax=Anguilla anguilla TaxID=7936 RepID=A0A0E9SJ73_ANGAN